MFKLRPPFVGFRMSAQSIIRSIEKRQHQLKKALATDNSDELLSHEDRKSLENLERMASIYRYQRDTAKGLLEIGQYMLSAYDNYIALLHDLREGIQTYLNITSPSNCKSPKMLMSDTLFWFKEFKKIIIRFQTFIRGASFVEFRLLFKNYYVVNREKDDEEMSMSVQTTKTFGKWTDMFTSKNILKGRIRAISSYEEDNDYPHSTCNTLEILSSDALKLKNIDNTPFVVLESAGLDTGYLIYLDYVCLDESITDELNLLREHHRVTEGVLREVMTEVAKISDFLFHSARNNKALVESDYHYIEVTQESACSNLEFIESEIENITQFDQDDFISMIENGNLLKEQLRKLPSIGNKSLFSYQEKKRLGFHK